MLNVSFNELSDDVCITGISGCFPESASVNDLAENLFNKVDLVTEDDRRWIQTRSDIPHYTGKVEGLNKFDSKAFKIEYKAAHTMDPMQRMLMEKTYECIIDAGINPDDLRNTRTGVFLACILVEAEAKFTYENMHNNEYGLTGCQRFMLAHRISEWLKLKGPSYNMDSACSSSLYALEQAYNSIREGECDAAIVAGCNLCLLQNTSLIFTKLGVLNDDGKSKCFDDRANGYVRSESIVACLLQKAKDSRRIYTKIVYAKTNCDGFKPQGVHYPAGAMQRRLIEDFYNICGVDPTTVEFVEAHATGTQVGDFEESNAIAEVFCKNRSKPLFIGSIKSNLGHGEGSSALNSIAKGCIAYNTGFLPPNIHFEVPRQGVPALINGQFKVVTEKTPWSRGYFAISNFGFGGANGHVLMENISEPKINNGLPLDNLPRLVCISGQSQAGLDKVFNDLESRTVDVDEVGLWHSIFKKPIKHHSYRGYVLLGSTPDRSVQLARECRYIHSNNVISRDFKVCFKYSTLRSHWRTIATQLMHIPVFASSIHRFSSTLESKGLNFLNAINKTSTEDKYSVLGNIAVHVALTDVLKAIGIKPNYIIGEDIVTLWGAYVNDSSTAEHAILAAHKISEACDSSFQRTTAAYNQQSSMSSNSVVIHIGLHDDTDAQEIPLVNENTDCVQYLFTALGKLHLKGIDLNLAQMYPAVSFPVALGTPMLSHLVDWDHSDNWTVLDTREQLNRKSNIGETIVKINLQDEDQEFLTGHIIDGRIIYPATGYLVLVWNTLAEIKKKDITNVVFEDIYLMRATTFTKNDCLELNINIQIESGRFEITENKITVVTGRIYEAKNVGKEFRVIPDAKTKNYTTYNHHNILCGKDLYKEMKIRGYGHKGLFRGVHNCNVFGTEGSVYWKDNWITFLDSILQFQIIAHDFRSLHMPTRLERVAIDVELHRELVKRHNQIPNVDVVLPLKGYSNLGVFRAGGVEIRGIHFTGISKKPPLGNPIYEKNVFVPNYVESMQIEDAIRTDVQIILENILVYRCKVLELADDVMYTKNNLQPIIDIFGTVLSDIPLVQVELVLLSNSKKYFSEPNAMLFIGACLFSRPDILEEFSKTLKPKSYILSREMTRPRQSNCPDGYNIVTVLGVQTEYLVLMNKINKGETVKYIQIETSDKRYSWIEKVKADINSGSKIGLYSQNEPINGLLGLVNCLRRESGGENITGILITDPTAPKFDPELEFYKNQLDLGLGINVYKDGQWGTYRHLLLEKVQDVPVIHAYLKPTVYGDLSSLRFQEGPLCIDEDLLQDNNTINVYCSALNFRDIMSAMGRIKAEAIVEGRINQECVQGIEIAGKLNDGTRVMGMGAKGITNLIHCKECIWRIPDEWTFAEAVTVPVAYATVYLAMVLMGKIKKGESILIHAGTGGVGQAAINVALAYDLEVFTTVGTPAKRAFIRRLYPQINDDHIGNSRDISFEQLIRRATEGKGVDLVLNSLADEKLQASLKCLKPGGRFLEIGKYDISSNTQIKTCFLNKGISFFGIHLDFKSIAEKPQVVELVREGIGSGVVRPITYCTFEVDEVEQAFRYMAAGKHIGKVVIKIRPEEPIGSAPARPTYFPIKATPRYNCSKQYVYVLVGGLGGFGLELADWIVMRGGRKLVFSSRRGVSNGYQALRFRYWQEYGAELEVCTADVSSEQGCEELLRVAGALGPVRAIFNLAVVLHDAVFDNQTPDTFTTSFLPKAQATIHLDKLSRKLCPELKDFVVFSSVSCGRGNAGQSNYGFSNSVMERICEQRRQDGFPALAIQWGAIGDVGLVADMQEENIQLEIGGTFQQKISSCLESLDVFLKQDAVIVSSIVVAEKRAGGGGINNVVDAIATILGITNMKTISKQLPLSEMGMDSVMATEIKQTLERDFEILLNAQEIRMLTFAKLIEFAKQMSAPGETKNTETIDNNNNNKDSVKLIYKNFGDESTANEEFLCLPSLASTLNETNTFADEIMFLLPGIESCAEALRILCSKLKIKTIVMQLGTTKMDLEAMVARLYKVVKEKLVPGGTFHLLGYSFGVLPILQLAATLEDEGYQGLVICIDGSPTFSKKLVKETVNFENKKQMENYMLMHMFNLVSNSVPGMMKMLEETVTLEDRLRSILHLLPFKLEYSLEFLHLMVSAILDRAQVLFKYNNTNIVKKISSRIVLIRQKVMSSAIDCNECYDLDKFTNETISVHGLNYGHKEIIDSDECANIVNETLEHFVKTHCERISRKVVIMHGA